MRPDGMDNLRRFPAHIGIHQQGNSEQHEGNREQLAHVEHHVLLKSDLGLLDELYQEPHPEADDEEEADEEAPVDLVEPVLVDPHENQAQYQIRQGLVDLRGVLGFGLAAWVRSRRCGRI